MNKQIKILNPVRGIETDLKEISLHYQNAENSGSIQDLNRLKTEVGYALKRRDSMLPQELDAVQIIYPNISRRILSGEVFREMYAFLSGVEEGRDFDVVNETREGYVQRMLREKRMNEARQEISSTLEDILGKFKLLFGGFL